MRQWAHFHSPNYIFSCTKYIYIYISTKNSRPFFKTVWDHVYDIPLISSLNQLLSNDFVLQEVCSVAVLTCSCNVTAFYVHVYTCLYIMYTYCTLNMCKYACICRCSEAIKSRIICSQIIVMDLHVNLTPSTHQAFLHYKFLLTMMMWRSVTPLVHDQRRIN